MCRTFVCNLCVIRVSFSLKNGVSPISFFSLNLYHCSGFLRPKPDTCPRGRKGEVRAVGKRIVVWRIGYFKTDRNPHPRRNHPLDPHHPLPSILKPQTHPLCHIWFTLPCLQSRIPSSMTGWARASSGIHRKLYSLPNRRCLRNQIRFLR